MDGKDSSLNIVLAVYIGFNMIMESSFCTSSYLLRAVKNYYTKGSMCSNSKRCVKLNFGEERNEQLVASVRREKRG